MKKLIMTKNVKVKKTCDHKLYDEQIESVTKLKKKKKWWQSTKTQTSYEKINSLTKLKFGQEIEKTPKQKLWKSFKS